MSSAEEEFNENENHELGTTEPGSKKRRVQRACDVCRRKKIRCDGSQMPGNQCSNCIAYNFDCTYNEAAKKRGPPKGYVESLEVRLEKMEKLLQQVCPDADFTQELGPKPSRERNSKGPNLSTPHIMNAPSTSSATNSSTPTENVVPSDDEEMISLRLTETFQNMNISPLQMRFFGKSSGVMLIQKAIDLKKEYTGDEDIQRQDILRPRRPEFDNCFPWELAAKNIVEPAYLFPDEDLAASLIDLYFEHVNITLPLLHRPTFERKVAQCAYMHHSSFGAVYLLVCAVGARYSDDPRVFLEGTNSEHSSGWKFFEQVQMVRKTLLGPPCLEELQVYCLSVIFLQGTSAPQACWTIVGIGIRLAQDVGAHRRQVYSEVPTAEDELWKRAFWILVTLDRLMSSSLGRPCAIQDEDFDLDLPIDCDDEYWEHPDPAQVFRQPPDKPSTMSFFVNFLKLNHILAFALRTIYSINKSRILLGFVGQQWEQHIVAELDSALNKWIDAVPDHLRWDPNREKSPLFAQSCCLYGSYYHLQILIHRPFIPSPRKPSPLSFPSLAICTNAARSCSHVLDIYRRRTGESVPFLQLPSFTAGIVLLLNIWGGKRSGLSTDPVKEMADVHKCMSNLKACERRWHTSGRLWRVTPLVLCDNKILTYRRDVLYELASVGDLPLPQPSPTGGVKRDRDSNSNSTASTTPSTVPSTAPSTVSLPEVSRSIAGPRRISRDVQSQHQRPPQTPNAISLPVYSNELGRLPLHGQVDFANIAPENSSGNWFNSMPENSVVPHHHHLPTLPSSSRSHEYNPPAVPEAPYAMDEMFYNQLASEFGTQFQPAQNPAPYAMHPQSMQSVGTQPSMVHHPGQNIVDPDTIAMWSNAPTGFGPSDWGSYIMSVSGMAHADGISDGSRHGVRR
ncbi:fungal-specific transcription factor domain-containing protein [Hygrophoropsis aurantiaca]|uniref:Fungal-specific transcription factor domain-containing protein n=1 Tax=Hygrophoropsis aurantiaca TaxID=72124 RepID=A0ACB8AKB6_9AGAM|nr:fungal-specific transcription factor domain-containing protein [Hygrophoropsis aurantiaca]